MKNGLFLSVFHYMLVLVYPCHKWSCCCKSVYVLCNSCSKSHMSRGMQLSLSPGLAVRAKELVGLCECGKKCGMYGMAASRSGLIWGLSSRGRGITTSSWSHTWKALCAKGCTGGWWLEEMLRGLWSLSLSSSPGGPSIQSVQIDMAHLKSSAHCARQDKQ